MKPVIFTFTAVPVHPGAVRMRESCEHFGWPVDLMVGPWEGDVKSQVRNFAARLSGYRDKGYTHALRLDSFDVVCVGPPSDLQAALAHYGNPVLLIGAELAAWPGNYRISDYPHRAHPWWFAHSPCLVDLRQELPAEYLHIADESYGADQKHFADLILDKKPGVAIDRDCRWLQSLGHCNPWSEFFTVEGKRVRNKITGTLPLFVHANGSGANLADLDWVPRHNSPQA